MAAKKSWHWHAGEDPVLGKVDKTITLESSGLSYTGWSDDPGFGGGYAIGFQAVAEFLKHGPLDQKVPAALVEEIRAYLVEGVELTALPSLKGRGNGSRADVDPEPFAVQHPVLPVEPAEDAATTGVLMGPHGAPLRCRLARRETAV